MKENNNTGDPVLPDRLRDLLLERKLTVAVAESVTAGHLQVAFSMAEWASEFFQGGITTYNLGQKARHLHVDPIHGLTCNSVSEIVAAEMAKHVAKLFMSDWGIAITGYASPIPEKDIYELYACYSFCRRDNKIITKTIKADGDNPGEIRRFYTKYILEDFFEVLSRD